MASDLQRFVDAQSPVYVDALAELRRGRKQSHWMWFVFPQLRGLGRSAMADFHGLASIDEAKAYLEHPLLGRRLVECAQAMLAHAGRSADAILGPVDAVKLRSSTTLFECAAGGGFGPFGAVLDTFFGGVRDQATLRMLAGARE
jgi:uncharacterized protein (DUF1810 family)